MYRKCEIYLLNFYYQYDALSIYVDKRYIWWYVVICLMSDSLFLISRK